MTIGRNITPYEQEIEEPVIAKLVEELVKLLSIRKDAKRLLYSIKVTLIFQKGLLFLP